MLVATPTSAPRSAPPRPADPEVASATTRYAPMTPGTDRPTFDRLVGVARTALDGLAPVVVVNRRADATLYSFEQAPAEPLLTIHTLTPPGLSGEARRLGRLATERLHGTHGTGDNAGQTVFGSTRFVGTADARAGAASVLSALARQGDVGVGAYGPVSLLVRPDALEGRTTFAARDTAKGITRVSDASHMPEIVAERIARGVPGAPTVDELVSSPAARAARLLRTWLTSDGPARRDGYIEAQVRTLRPTDFAGMHVAHAYDGPVMKSISPGALPDESVTARLHDAATRLGLAFADGPSPAS
jgi:hypothetical protein